MPQDPTLPPGVSVSMIPGNRPEDEWFEKFIEDLGIPITLSNVTSPEKAAALVNSFLALIEDVVAAGIVEDQIRFECRPSDVDESAGMARVLQDVEGSLLAFWTDLPESECQRLIAEIQEVVERYRPIA